MSSKRLILRDELSLKKTTASVSNLWTDTEVIVGYGYHDGGLGKSYLDEDVLVERNTVPIVGVQSALQYLFGVKGPDIKVPTLYEESGSGIGLPNKSISNTYNYLTPDHSQENDPLSGATSVNPLYNTGHFVQLFGVGVTGTAENNITVHKVGYRETSINMNGDPNGIMYPFRFTANDLDGAEKTKYFGKKLDATSGATGYYLKRFEGKTKIKHVWKTQDTMNSDTEIAAEGEEIYDASRNDAIQTFAEMHLQITNKDLKEFFGNKLQQPESCRFNCIALYDGYYTEDGKPDGQLFGDYCNVRLFSKLNIPTEHLSLSKDIEIIYRVYGS